jgi:two-component system NtrC family sensor kinase
MLLLNLLVFGGFAVAVLVVTNDVFHKSLQNAVSNEIAQVSQLLNLALSLPSSSGEYESIQAFFEEFMEGGRSGSLSYLVMLDSDGVPIVSIGEIEYPLPPPDDRSFSAFDKNIFNVRQPLLLADYSVGDLQFGFRLDALIDASRSARSRVLVLLLLSIGILAVIQIWVVRYVSRRIESLAETTVQFAKGDYGVRSSLAAGDELALLGDNFNRMAVTIEARIDELTHARVELKQLNSELEERVQSRTRELADKNQVLEETLTTLHETRHQLVESEKLSSLGSLVAGVSHELNTPIGNAVLMNSAFLSDISRFRKALEQGLKRSDLDRFVESATGTHDMLQRNLERSAQLLHNFRQVAIDQTSVQRRIFMLDEFVQELISTLQPSLNRKNLVLVTDIAAGLQMDSYPGPLGQVLTHLLTNAVAHGLEGVADGLVRIEARVPYERQDWIEMTVSDNGKGMPEAVLKRIFEPFFTTRLGCGGSGLGMHIVYSLVSGLLGGKIVVESVENSGTTVRLWLPRGDILGH